MKKKKWWILVRTGNVYSSFFGDRKAVEEHIASINQDDSGGSSKIHAGFFDEEECRKEFERLGSI